ncbi:MAG: hypothetical protein ACKOBL_07865, partial [Chloroflexota bacterium]
ICVWPVYFFGGQKVAVTVYPPPHGNDRNDIFGLEVTGDSGQSLRLNSDFLLYSGLEDGNPKRVPLRVRLFAEEGAKIPDSPSFQYLNSVKGTLNSSFADAAENAVDGVVRIEWPETYADYRSYVESFDETRTPYTEVQQVDQFWANSKDTGFTDLLPYLSAPTMNVVIDNGVSRLKADERNDPYGEFQLFPIVSKGVHPGGLGYTICRASFLIDPWLGANNAYTHSATFVQSNSPKSLADQGSKMSRRAKINARGADVVSVESTPKQERRVTRVPLHADFGFILADRDLWFNARFETLCAYELESASDDSKKKSKVLYSWLGDYNSLSTVGDVWNALCLDGDEFRESSTARIEKRAVSWSQFFDACEIVADFSDAPAFDLDLDTGENLTCLILEVWLSSIENFLACMEGRHGAEYVLPAWLDRLQKFLLTVGEEEIAG